MSASPFSKLQTEVSRLVGARASLAAYLALEKQIEPSSDVPGYVRRPRLALLSNFTIQGLPEAVRARGLFHNLLPETYLGPYNQYAQEIVNNQSGLYAFRPDLVYLVLDRATIPDAAFPGAMVRELLGRFSGRVVVFDEATKAAFQNEPRVMLLDLPRWLGESGHAAHWNTKYKELGDLRLAPAAFPDFAEALLAPAVAVSGAARKCVVLDLDNTLWRGIVGEDGKDGIAPHQALQMLLAGLYGRGILLAINSRNNSDEALDAIETHPGMRLRKKHFAAWQINWGDKAANMTLLAKELNLGIDSFVFLDDDPFQAERMREAFPSVATVPFGTSEAEAAAFLGRFAGFSSVALTDEDRARGAMYAAERERRDLQSKFSSLDDFLRELELHVAVATVTAETLPRASQLTQKTNQFNLTTRRYTEEDMRAFAGRGGKAWTVAAKDRFGDYGITGLIMVEPGGNEQWRVDNFLLSCRILGRGVEGKAVEFLVREAKQRGIRELSAKYVPTSKNGQVERFWDTAGFDIEAARSEKAADGIKRYRRVIEA